MPDSNPITNQELRAIAAGLLHDQLDVDRLTPTAKAELRLAIDVILRIANHPASTV